MLKRFKNGLIVGFNVKTNAQPLTPIEQIEATIKTQHHLRIDELASKQIKQIVNPIERNQVKGALSLQTL